MKSFELLEPTRLEDVVGLLDPEDPGVRLIAGGTALMLMMKTRLYQPTRLVSVRRLETEYRGVRVDGDGTLLMGAFATLSELEHSPTIATAAPVLTRTLRTLSNVRVRNVATLGGHLAHGDPHMDLPPVLVALGARALVVGPGGRRWIDMGEFFVGYYATAVARDELIVEVAVPPQPADARTAYVKFTALSADDWPAVGVAVRYREVAGRMIEARLTISAATERPVRVQAAEELLVGAAPDAHAFARAADAAADAVDPMSDLRGSAAYKREMVRVHVRRALSQARDGATTPRL